MDWGQDGPTSDHLSAESEILRRSDEIAGFSDGGTFEPRQHSFGTVTVAALRPQTSLWLSRLLLYTRTLTTIVRPFDASSRERL